MNVLLLQLDGKLPNIALMRIAAHHAGDDVELRLAPTMRAVEPRFWDTKPDCVYASLIFEKTKPIARRALELYPDAIIGGTGWDEKISLEQHGVTTRKQDYSIYPNYRHSIGYSQRGCRYKCPFCKVPTAEGKVMAENAIRDIWRGPGHPKEICLLDNDFFGQPDWEKHLDFIRRFEFKVCFNQGINVRAITDFQAQDLAKVHYSDDQFKRRRLYTAWDNAKDEDRLFTGLERLQFYGVKPDEIMVYMLIGFWDGPQLNNDDFSRQEKLRAFGCRPYPMPYVRTDELVGFQRWVVGAYDKRIPWESWERAGYRPERIMA